MIIQLIQGAVIGMVLTLTPNSLPAQGQPAKTTMPPGWIEYVKACSQKHGVDPAFALAVAEVESSCKGQRFRFGKMGKGTYYGPFGIHKCFLAKWDIADPYVNTEVGIRALARFRNKRRTLQSYNASFTAAYYRRVMELAKKNEREISWPGTQNQK